MSGSNCCFLTCIQLSQEAGKVVWYYHLFKNFPQFVLIYTVKGFSKVNEADVFLEFSCFYFDWTDVGNLIFGSSAFSKSSLYIWKFSVHVLLESNLRILNITFLASKMSKILRQFEHSLTLWRSIAIWSTSLPPHTCVHKLVCTHAHTHTRKHTAMHSHTHKAFRHSL